MLQEGADALASDSFHCRTALHYAALGGHADCVRILCADTTKVTVDGTTLPLKDTILQDLQVRSAKYIDQRSFGGLTALHYAVVSCDLNTVMEMLRAGASIMVKTDGDAYIGDDFLIPGSSPLHVAVIMRNIPIAHAIIQAHSDMMFGITGSILNERRRRPWEGHSRTDIRSMRNSQRRLPYHLAREKGWTQMMQLVDPRIPADYALDAVRDLDCLGPKRLATICSLVMQKSLLEWLDRYEQEIAIEKDRRSRTKGSSKKKRYKRAWTIASLTASLASGPSSPNRDQCSLHHSGAPNETLVEMNQVETNQDNVESTTKRVSDVNKEGTVSSPFARWEDTNSNDRDENQYGSTRHEENEFWVPNSRNNESFLNNTTNNEVCQSDAEILSVAFRGPGFQASGALQTYVGMLSERQPLNLTRNMNSYPVLPRDEHFVSPSEISSQLVRSVSLDTYGSPNSQRRTELIAEPSNIKATESKNNQRSGSHPNSPAPGSGMMRALTNIRYRLRSLDFSQPMQNLNAPSSFEVDLDSPISPREEEISPRVHKHSGGTDKCDIDSDKDSFPNSNCATDDENESTDPECGVCLDRPVAVAFAGCNHMLCVECARNLTKQDKKPPICPFCREMVVGFRPISSVDLEVH